MSRTKGHRHKEKDINTGRQSGWIHISTRYSHSMKAELSRVRRRKQKAKWMKDWSEIGVL